MSLRQGPSYCTTRGEGLICDGCNKEPGTKTLHQPFKYGDENICMPCYAIYIKCEVCPKKDINDKYGAHELCSSCKGKMTNKM